MDPVRVSNYGVGEDLFETIVKLISTAERRVWIKVAWWDASPKGRELVDAVVSARRRGLEVMLLIRPEASNDAALRPLRQAGVNIVGVRFIHEKELLADDTALTHSMNFTNKEIVRNQNSGFVFRDSDEVAQIEDGFRILLDSRATVSLGEERWTPAHTLIPPEFARYLDQYDKLNPLQSLAVPTVLSTDKHVMVVAPTSSGKTLIGEVAALRSIITEGKPAVWLLPARALATEVAETAQRWRQHGIRSLELTGATNVSSAAATRVQLWIATTEKFEALYRRGSLREFIARIGCVVIDEVHLVGDPSRGATLESLIARLRAAERRTRIVALSATVSNAEELAEWFNADLVSSAWRPTVLTTQLIPYDPAPPRSRAEEYEAAKDAAVASLLEDLLAKPAESTVLEPEPLQNDGSVLIFCGTKPGVRRTAALIASIPFRGVSDDILIDEAFKAGVGIHFRDAHEADRAVRAFKKREIKTLVATSGLSTGVNMPARAVVIRDLQLGIEPLDVSQAQQMFGRAGRAGQEPEGFAFMLVPRDEETAWKAKLVAGYTARSRVLDHLLDAILAEVLIGSIVDRSTASTWFAETFAYAQADEPIDVDAAIDKLVGRGFVAEFENRFAITEIGKLTSRLMVDVESAGRILTSLTEAPVPTEAAEAEELVLQILTSDAAALRAWPVNPKVYEEVVGEILGDWSPGVVSRMGRDFGSRFCAAAAHLALRDPRRLNGKKPLGVAPGDFRRAVEDMPRYLAWIAALGYAGHGTWAPAVAGDLARRLTWWQLNPHPQRGAGRLLWLLEKTFEPQSQRGGVPSAWSRARDKDFNSPDLIKSRPLGADLSPEQFQTVLDNKAAFELQLAAASLELEIRTEAKSSRTTVMSNTGARRTLATVLPTQRRMEIPIPLAQSATEIAADIFLYTRDGDFAYKNLIADLPEDLRAQEQNPIEEAKTEIDKLPDRTVVGSGPKGIRRVFMSDHRRKLASVIPLLSPDPALRPVALALASHEVEPDLAIVNLRSNLKELLDERDSPEPRPASTVLRSGHASPDELELTLAALAGSLQIETGVATSDDRIVGLVKLSGEWHLAMPSDSRNLRIDPLHPPELPPIVSTIRPRPSQDQSPARPKCAWLDDFTSG